MRFSGGTFLWVGSGQSLKRAVEGRVVFLLKEGKGPELPSRHLRPVFKRFLELSSAIKWTS